MMTALTKMEGWFNLLTFSSVIIDSVLHSVGELVDTLVSFLVVKFFWPLNQVRNWSTMVISGFNWTVEFDNVESDTLWKSLTLTFLMTITSPNLPLKSLP